MGLFSKKTCAICGGDIGLLGNRKLEDGDMCKECARKLSPWFSERRKSTVEQIKQQLQYREQNKAEVARFRTTRTLGMGRPGTNTLLYLDESAGKFMVTRSSKLAEANPDVISLSQVTSCEVEVTENRTELKMKGKEGNDISYNPPRYEYRYDFYVNINVNSPWFDDIRYKLNDDTVKVIGQDYGFGSFFNGGSNSGIIGGNVRGPGQTDLMFQECRKLGEQIKFILTGGQGQFMGGQPYAQPQQYVNGQQGYAQPQQFMNGQQPYGQPQQFVNGQQPYGQPQQFMNGQQPYGQPQQFVNGQQPYMNGQYGQPQQPYMNGQQGYPNQQPYGNVQQQPYVQQVNQTMTPPAGAAGVVVGGMLTCPWCGGQVGGGRFCELCGGSLQG